jgi:hypothetical protein
MMADFLPLSLNQWTAWTMEASPRSSDWTVLPATHNTHNMHNTHYTHTTHNTHNTYDVSFTDTITIAESIRFSSRFKTSATVGFQPTELGTTEYVTNRTKVICHGPGLMSDHATNRNRAMDDIQSEINVANHSESHDQAENFAKFCYLNECLATPINDLEDTVPIQDGPSRELAATKQEIEGWEEDLQIEKRRSAN